MCRISFVHRQAKHHNKFLLFVFYNKTQINKYIYIYIYIYSAISVPKVRATRLVSCFMRNCVSGPPCFHVNGLSIKSRSKTIRQSEMDGAIKESWQGGKNVGNQRCTSLLCTTLCFLTSYLVFHACYFYLWSHSLRSMD
jgi:hypothetical protein